MSEPVTALGGAAFDGIAQIAEAPLQGMITLRGALDAPEFAEAVQEATGLTMPSQREIVLGSDAALAWMSPDELLLLCSYDTVTQTCASLQDVLADLHALAVDVSDARAMFKVSGPNARDVLAKLAPVDLRTFAPNMFRRTRLAQVPAAMWMTDGGAIHVVCFRSHAQYVFDLLQTAAVPGSEVISGQN